MGGRFRGDLWYERQMEKRTRAALNAREAGFIAEHKQDTNDELLAYVRLWAEENGHTPHMEELIGGRYIRDRLGGWGQALQAAGLPAPSEKFIPSQSALYKEERQRQAAQYRRERSEKRAQKQAVLKARQEQRAKSQKKAAKKKKPVSRRTRGPAPSDGAASGEG